MNTSRWPSLGLKDGFNIGTYSTIDEGDKAAGRLNAMLEEANAGLVYRGALAQARKTYVAELEKASGIVRSFKEVDNKAKTKKLKVYTESEGDYADRVAALIVSNDPSAKAISEKFKVTGTDPMQRKVQTDTALQAFADSLPVQTGVAADGTPVYTNNGTFNVDIKEAERKTKEAALSQGVINAAKTIIANKAEAKWVGIFTTEGIVAAPFDTKPKKGASEEEVTAITNTNVTNLALAIKEREKRRADEIAKKRAAEYQ